MRKRMVIFAAAVLASGMAWAGQSPVGKWQDDTGRKNLEFIADGTVVLSGPDGEIKTVVGRWTNASDGKILLQFNSMYGTMGGYAHFEGATLVVEDRPIIRMHHVQ